MGSAGRRALVIAVAVAGADLPIAPMDQQLAVLIARDLAGGLDSFGLHIVDGSAALISGSADGPASIGGDYMLVLWHCLLVWVKW